MEVILLERIEKLGLMGDVVSVKPGYARNFLLPQKKALRATENNLKSFENRRAELEATNLNQRKEAESAAKKLEGMSLILIRSAGESGQLYGSVSARDITKSMAESGVTIERRQVELAHPIKSLGLHTAHIRLHPEVVVDIILNVAKSEDEARSQAVTVGETEAEQEEKPVPVEAVVEAAEEVAETTLTEEVAEEFFEEPESVTVTDEDMSDAEKAEKKDD